MKRSLLTGFVLFLGGCMMEVADPGSSELLSDEPYDPEIEEANAPEVARTSAALESFRTGRTREDYRTAVRILIPKTNDTTDWKWGCTGAVIAPDMIMTAAHCVDHLPNYSSFELAATGVFDDRESGYLSEKHCITDLFHDDDDECGSHADDTAKVVLFRNTAFRRWDASTDVAVLKLMTRDSDGVSQIKPGYKRPFFSNYAPDADCADEASGDPRYNKTPCYLRILDEAPRVGGWFEFNGWGVTRDGATDGGTKLNFGLTKADWVRSGHFGRDVAESDQERACNGDSGGPAVAHNGDYGFDTKRLFLIGIHSGSDTDDSACTDAGDAERWGRVDTHMWLITNSPADSDRGAGRPCNRYTISGAPYYKCWDSSDWLL